jgi:hypothetical protein
MERLHTVRRLGTATFVTLLCLAAAGCSGSNSDSASSGTVSGAAAEVTVAAAGGLGGTDTVAPSGDSGGDPAAPPAVVPANDDRKVIITITVGVEVDDVAAAVNKVIALSSTHGGELSASSVDLSNPETAGGDLVFRIPPEQTDAFLAGLDPGIGRRTGLTTGSKDVSLALTDLQGRIDNARDSLDRVRALLAEAKDIGAVISLESELTKRQDTLEGLLAQQADLKGQVAMSTVTVHLSATGTAPEPAAKEDTGIGHAFRTGWHGFTTFLGGIVKFIGYTLPFLLLLALMALVAVPISRRVRRNRSAVPPPPPTPVEDRQMSAPGS